MNIKAFVKALSVIIGLLLLVFGIPAIGFLWFPEASYEGLLLVWTLLGVGIFIVGYFILMVIGLFVYLYEKFDI